MLRMKEISSKWAPLIIWNTNGTMCGPTLVSRSAILGAATLGPIRQNHVSITNQSVANPGASGPLLKMTSVLCKTHHVHRNLLVSFTEKNKERYYKAIDLVPGKGKAAHTEMTLPTARHRAAGRPMVDLPCTYAAMRQKEGKKDRKCVTMCTRAKRVNASVTLRLANSTPTVRWTTAGELECVM